MVIIDFKILYSSNGLKTLQGLTVIISSAITKTSDETNRKAENFLEIYSCPATGINCIYDNRKVLSRFIFSLILSPKEVQSEVKSEAELKPS